MFFLCASAYAQTKPLSSCGNLFSLNFRDTLSGEEETYLGVSGKHAFPLKKIKGSVLVFEVFSTFCTVCPQNVPVINTVYSSIENDPALKGKVNVIGIAIGNTRNEVSGYKKEHKILFPILTDYNFAAHKALGNPRVPYTIIIKKTADRAICSPVYTHQGILDSADGILKVLKGPVAH